MGPTIELAYQLRVCLATVFSLYLKTHNYHWNVTGPNFSEYHKFFGEVYQGVWESVDDYAEHIRTLNEFPLGSLAEFARNSAILEATDNIPAYAMFKQLEDDNRILLEELSKAHDLAVEAGAYGVTNFLEGQIDYHNVLGWKLKAFTPLM